MKSIITVLVIFLLCNQSFQFNSNFGSSKLQGKESKMATCWIFALASFHEHQADVSKVLKYYASKGDSKEQLEKKVNKIKAQVLHQCTKNVSLEDTLNLYNQGANISGLAGYEHRLLKNFSYDVFFKKNYNWEWSQNDRTYIEYMKVLNKIKWKKNQNLMLTKILQETQIKKISKKETNMKENQNKTFKIQTARSNNYIATIMLRSLVQDQLEDQLVFFFVRVITSITSSSNKEKKAI